MAEAALAKRINDSKSSFGPNPMKPRRTKQNCRIALVCCLLVVSSHHTGSAANSNVPDTYGGYKVPLASQDLTFVNDKGRPISLKSFKSKWLVIFFGYTHCPDICPTTLVELGDVQKTLGHLATKVQFAFITVDPQRDNSRLLRNYISHFEGSFVGLTGSLTQISRAANEFGVTVRKLGSQDQKDYMLGHTSVLYVIDPQQKERVSFFSPLDTRRFANYLAKRISPTN